MLEEVKPMNVFLCGTIGGHSVYVVAEEPSDAQRYADTYSTSRTAIPYDLRPESLKVPDGAIVLFDKVDHPDSQRLMKGQRG